MKKFLFLSLAATAMLTGCSNDDTLGEAQTASQAISFNTFVDKSTRGNDISTANISSMTVYGWSESTQIFDAQYVSVSNSQGTYSPTQYWDASSSYTFEAVAPDVSQNSSITVVASEGKSQIQFSNQVAGADVDLLYAGPNTVTTGDDISGGVDPVGFTFKHLLSRVRFTFGNGFSSTSDMAITITDVKITNAYSKGTITPADGLKWTLTGDDAFGVSFASTNVSSVVVGSSAESDHMYLIPSSASKTYNVSFYVTATSSSTGATATNSLSGTVTATLEPGYSYNFAATIDETNADSEGKMNPIVFSVSSVTSWEAYTDGSVVISSK